MCVFVCVWGGWAVFNWVLLIYISQIVVKRRISYVLYVMSDRGVGQKLTRHRAAHRQSGISDKKLTADITWIFSRQPPRLISVRVTNRGQRRSDRQTDRQAGRQIGRQTDWRTEIKLYYPRAFNTIPA